jgi:hypothetical protein
MFQITVAGEMGEQFFKDALIAPPVKAPINGIPFTVTARKQAPLRAGTSNPKHGFEESAHVASGTETDFGKRFQDWQYLLPLVISQLNIHIIE